MRKTAPTEILKTLNFIRNNEPFQIFYDFYYKHNLPNVTAFYAKMKEVIFKRLFILLSLKTKERNLKILFSRDAYLKLNIGRSADTLVIG